MSYTNGRRRQNACFDRDSTPVAIGGPPDACCGGATRIARWRDFRAARNRSIQPVFPPQGHVASEPCIRSPGGDLHLLLSGTRCHSWGHRLFDRNLPRWLGKDSFPKLKDTTSAVRTDALRPHSRYDASPKYILLRTSQAEVLVRVRLVWTPDRRRHVRP